MATTLTPVNSPANPDITGREVLVYFNVALNGNYGTSGSNGDILNLTQLADLVKSSQLPLYVDVWEAPPAGTAPTFVQLTYCPGTTQANGLLAIAAIGVEITGGTAYSATTPVLTNAVIKGVACFPAY